MDTEIIDTAPEIIRAMKKISESKTERPAFSPEQMRKLLEHATTNWNLSIRVAWEPDEKATAIILASPRTFGITRLRGGKQ